MEPVVHNIVVRYDDDWGGVLVECQCGKVLDSRGITPYVWNDLTRIRARHLFEVADQDRTSQASGR